MRVYLIKDEDIKRLRDNIQLSKYHAAYKHDAVTRQIVNEIYRWFNYRIESWLSEIKE